MFLKQTCYLLFAVFLVLQGTPAVQAAGAATMILSPQSQTVEVGNTFKVTIDVNASNEEIDTVRAYVSFSKDLLQATDVSLGNLFSRVSPGSSIDNTSGEISMGGFTLDGPVNGSGVFATITFEAIAEGQATIAVSPSSKMISAGVEKINPSSVGSSTVTIGAITFEDIEEGAAYLTVESPSHPNQSAWSSEKNANFSWSIDGGSSDITSYLVAFDDQLSTDPAIILSAEIDSYEVTDIADGLWYFHIKGVHASGVVTNTVHYTVRVDATVPNPLEPSVSQTQLLEGESVELYFGTTDETSGILYYQVAINGGEYVPKASPVIFEDLVAGTYLLQVGAVDYAGNETYGSVSVRVYPEGYDLERPVGYGEEKTEKEGAFWNTTTMAVTVIVLLLVIGGGIVIGLRKKK